MKDDICSVIRREIDIVEYARHLGLHLVKHGSQGLLRTEEHDSLILDPQKQLFNWNSRGIVDSSVIDFAMAYQGITARQAISELRGLLNRGMEYTNVRRTEPHKSPAKEPKPFALPEKSKTGYKRVFGYLIKARGISSSVVQEMVNEKLLYQDARGNACFCGLDYDGECKYATLRGTGDKSPFKMDVGDRKDVNFSYNLVGKQPERLFVCEAAIDCLSIMTMLEMHGMDYKQFSYLALGGVYAGALEYHIKQHPNLQKVYLCQDNDEAGHNSRKECREVLRDAGYRGKVVDKMPFSNDFNEDVQRMKGIHSPQQAQTQQQTVQPPHQSIERGLQHGI